MIDCLVYLDFLKTRIYGNTSLFLSVNDDKNLDGAKVAAAFGLKVYKCEIDLLSTLGLTKADEYLLNAVYWDESEPGISLRLKKEGFFRIKY